jgi:hypothetical protein
VRTRKDSFDFGFEGAVGDRDGLPFFVVQITRLTRGVRSLFGGIFVDLSAVSGILRRYSLGGLFLCVVSCGQLEPEGVVLPARRSSAAGKMYVRESWTRSGC